LKYYILYVLFFTIGINCHSQKVLLKIEGNNTKETKTIDSLGYTNSHQNLQSALNETNDFEKKVISLGYLECTITDNLKKNDSTYSTKFRIGKITKNIHIYIGINSQLNKITEITKTNDTLILPYPEVESFLSQTLKKLEKKGYALAKLKLINTYKTKQNITSHLELSLDTKRVINKIVLQNTNNKQKKFFPIGHFNQINKKYKNKLFNEETVSEIFQDFEKYEFINQTKKPEILFKQDSTDIYIYLEKRNNNNFDGSIGFANNKQKKLTLNGYLDMTLENTLMAGEKFNLLWKNEGTGQKTFKTTINIPYLFKSPTGIKAGLHVFKQDSIFQNTKKELSIGYLLNYNTNFYLGYQSTESSDIQNTNNTKISDYKNHFYTFNFEYQANNNKTPLFPIKTSISATLGIGNRKTNDFPYTVEKSNQKNINIQIYHTIELNSKNYINLKNQTYLLDSKNYIVNELFRFGGQNSIRGFAENSLQANYLTSLITEYRYLMSPNLYLNTITDIALYKDSTSKKNQEKIISYGFGFGILTKTGVFKLIIANGKKRKEQLNHQNTMISLAYNVKF
jgi:hypothetical protein